MCVQTRGRKDSGLGTESPDGSTMALVTSPDLTKETKYSLVKDKIVKPPSPEIANVLVHSNGQLPNGLGKDSFGEEAKEVEGERRSSGRTASTPASQSSPLHPKFNTTITSSCYVRNVIKYVTSYL